MPLFAHVESSYAVDTQEAVDIEAYKETNNAPSQWIVVELPDGTPENSIVAIDRDFTILGIAHPGQKMTVLKKPE